MVVGIKGVALRKRLFVALSFPHLMYADVVLHGLSVDGVSRLNRALKACIHYLFRFKRYQSTVAYYDIILGCEWNVYSKIRAVTFLFKIINGLLPPYIFRKVLFLRFGRTGQLLTTQQLSTLFFVGIVEIISR